MNYFAATLTVAGFVASGHLLARALRLTLDLGIVGGVAVRFLLGASSVTMLVFLVSLLWPSVALTVGWTALLISMLAALTAVGRTLLLRGRGQAFLSWPFSTRLGAVVTALLTVESTLLTIAVLRAGLGGDGVDIWAIKGRMTFLAGGDSLRVVTDASLLWAHPTYPPLLPIDEALIYRAIGAVDEHALKVLFAAFTLCLIAVFYSLVRRLLNQGSAGFYTLILLGLPGVFANVVTGSADVPLATFLLAGGACLYFWLEHRNRSDLVLAGLLLASAAWLKQEGWLVWGVALISAGALASGRGRWRLDWRAACTFAIPAAFLLPWYLRLRELSVSEPVFSFTVSWLLGHIGRLPFLAGALLGPLVHGTSDALWLVLAIAVLLGLRPSRGAIFLAAALAIHLIAITGAYVFSTWVPYQDHVYFSIDRVVLQVVPLAAFLLAVTVREPPLQQAITAIARLLRRESPTQVEPGRAI